MLSKSFRCAPCGTGWDGCTSMARCVIGLTGNMGAGKTTLARRMQEAFGTQHICVDEIRRSIGGSDKDGFHALWHHIKDAVREEIERRLCQEKGTVILEWARLIEDDFLSLVNKVLVVDCAPATRMKRLANGDLALPQIEERLKYQMGADEILKLLGTQSTPYRALNTDEGITSETLHALYDDFVQDEFDADASFCLFRIPRKGGRVIWEITNSCNYGCRYCIFNSTPRKPLGELDTNKIYQTLDELKTCGFTHIKITGGEPFTRPDLMDILRYARQKDFKTDLSTNAASITTDIAQELASLGLDMVHVSLDGHTRELQETIRGKHTYEPTLEGLKNLIASGLYVRVGCVIYKNNQNALHELVATCHSLGCDEVIFSLMEPVGRMRNQSVFLTDRTVADLQMDIDKIKRAFEGRIKVSGNFAEVVKEGCGTCPGGDRFLFIDHKGRVSPCTWVAERSPSYRAEKTLHDYDLKTILDDKETTAFRHIVSDLASSGLDRCPMQIVSSFNEAEAISTLFDAGNFEAYLNKGGRYSEMSPVYVFATENIGDYVQHLDLEGKDVLTVGASGDHMIAAYGAGAKLVHNFDINRLARSMAELKWIALQALSREDFIRFFSDFDFEVYKKHRHSLSLNARYFFDKAYRHFADNGKALRNSALVRHQQPTEQIIANLPYLENDRGFIAAQTTCANRPFEWVTQSVEDAANDRGGSYDAILLSNISDYAHLMYDEDYLAVFRVRILEPMAERLRQGGMMMIGYVYDALDKNGSSARSLVNDRDERQRAFGDFWVGRYREIEIPNAWEDNNRDIILVWEKTR